MMMERTMSIQHTLAARQPGTNRLTVRVGALCRFAPTASTRTLKPINHAGLAGAHLPSLPFGYGGERNSRQSGRMTM